MPNYPANTMHTYLHRMHKRQNTGTDAMFDSCECVPGGAR